MLFLICFFCPAVPLRSVQYAFSPVRHAVRAPAAPFCPQHISFFSPPYFHASILMMLLLVTFVSEYSLKNIFLVNIRFACLFLIA